VGKWLKGWKAVLFKRFLSKILITNFLCTPVLALEFDTSIDDDIRRNYNPSKLEKDVSLPVLPKILNEKATQPNAVYKAPSTSQQKPQQAKPLPYKQTVSAVSGENYATLKQGTKIRVKLLKSISDRSQKGTPVVFVSEYPVSTTYFTIPMGTVFNGEIANSHKPQLSGNGGLIVVRINSVVLNGEIRPINGAVSEANFRKVFFNNIKGNRKYISSMFKSMKPGCRFFRKMLGVTGNLAHGGSEIILTPFSLGTGILVMAGNVFVSPMLAIFYKGDSIYFHEGSDFEIKLVQDVFIYK